MIRRILLATLVLAPLPTLAELPLGCFTRDYSAEHLAKNPNQHVASLKLRFHTGDDPGTLHVGVAGRFSAQGRARTDQVENKPFSQAASCGISAGKLTCFVDCDGGRFTITALSQGKLDIETASFNLESPEGCAPISNLAEENTPITSYRLTRTDDAACREVQ